MAEGSPNEWKILWEKEKLLVTSNFSFSHCVFKRLVLQTCKNQGLFGKGLIFPYRTEQIQDQTDHFTQSDMSLYCSPKFSKSHLGV